jgi:hypothetical protein
MALSCIPGTESLSTLLGGIPVIQDMSDARSKKVFLYWGAEGRAMREKELRTMERWV